jgi:hypothetical protein
MPNWCNNNIEITGPIDKIKALWDATQAEDGGLLNAMVPMPVELKDTVKGSNGDAVNWYDWSVTNWGTKWDVGLEGIEYTDNGDGTATISGYFDSAWSPPIEAYNRFLEANEDCSLTGSYYEMGCDFAGFYDNGDDEHLENLRDEYDLPEDEQSDLFKRLDEEYALSEQYDEWDLSEQFDQYDDDDEDEDEDEVVDNTDAVNALFNPKE